MSEHADHPSYDTHAEHALDLLLEAHHEGLLRTVSPALDTNAGLERLRDLNHARRTSAPPPVPKSPEPGSQTVRRVDTWLVARLSTESPALTRMLSCIGREVEGLTVFHKTVRRVTEDMTRTDFGGTRPVEVVLFVLDELHSITGALCDHLLTQEEAVARFERIEAELRQNVTDWWDAPACQGESEQSYALGRMLVEFERRADRIAALRAEVVRLFDDIDENEMLFS